MAQTVNNRIKKGADSVGFWEALARRKWAEKAEIIDVIL